MSVFPLSFEVSNTHYDENKEVSLYVDGSKQSVSGVLTQEGEMVHCVSRTLNSAEQDYAPIEFEMLSVVYSVKESRHFLRESFCGVYGSQTFTGGFQKAISR